jgi:hypothetical protein
MAKNISIADVGTLAVVLDMLSKRFATPTKTSVKATQFDVNQYLISSFCSLLTQILFLISCNVCPKEYFSLQINGS